jgi:hypothetical protein
MSNENLANKPFRPQMVLFRPSPITIMIFPHQAFNNPPPTPPKHFSSLAHSHHLTFGTGVLGLIQINRQPNAIIFQFIILTFVYSSICFERFPAHHQELNDCGGSLWFYFSIVVIVVLCSWSGWPAVNKRQDNKLKNCCIRLVIYLN